MVSFLLLSFWEFCYIFQLQTLTYKPIILYETQSQKRQPIFCSILRFKHSAPPFKLDDFGGTASIFIPSFLIKSFISSVRYTVLLSNHNALISASLPLTFQISSYTLKHAKCTDFLSSIGWHHPRR